MRRLRKRPLTAADSYGYSRGYDAGKKASAQLIERLQERIRTLLQEKSTVHGEALAPSGAKEQK